MIQLRASFMLAAFLLLSVKGQSVNDRVDCHPDANPNQTGCEDRGCIWDPTAPSGGEPQCYYPADYGYEVVGEVLETTLGYQIELRRTPNAWVPNEFVVGMVEIEFQTESRLRIKIHPNQPRYEVPLEDLDPVTTQPPSTLYDVEISNDPVFSFRVIRKSNSQVLFDSSLGGLTMADQFLQLAGKLPSAAKVYGFGEHEDFHFHHEMQWEILAMFNTDRAPSGDAAMYGTQPYYSVIEDAQGTTHSVLILNSNAQEVQLTPAPGIVYRTIGGVIDMYFFLGPTPEETTQQYTKFVGRYALPSYWAMGFHLCRWGYENIDNMKAAYQRTLDAGIPQDTQWSDIDFMDRRLDFTYDPVNFAGLPEFIDDLHTSGRRFVIIVDPGVPTGEPEGTYLPYEEGDRRGVWITDGSTGQDLLGKVWPDNPTKFPDFTNPVTHDWWLDSLQYWHDQISFDGLWIDMNEPANFVDGAFGGCDMSSSLNSPPYVPHIGSPPSATPNILFKTLCMDAQHKGGSHYNTHSMYGWWESRATKAAMPQLLGGERGFILSRSTYTGSGYYAAHWLGDNFSEWPDLRESIIGIIQYNQFGIPMVGVDICGFFNDTTEELCLRWHQAGAFYPFSRNHNAAGNAEQDPGMWSTVAQAAKTALETRYSLLPYLYTLFYQHSQTGSTVARSLWQQFPSDSIAWDIQEQFLWGSGLMISPVLYEGETTVNAYFPVSRWFDYYTGVEESLGGEYKVLDCPLTGKTPLHVRGGETFATQSPELTTSATRQNPFEILVALDPAGFSSGSLYWDDGISDVITSSSYITFDAITTNDITIFTSTPQDTGYTTPSVSSLKFYGVDATIGDVTVDSQSGVCSFVQTGTTVEVDCSAAPLDLLNTFEVVLF